MPDVASLIVRLTGQDDGATALLNNVNSGVQNLSVNAVQNFNVYERAAQGAQQATSNFGAVLASVGNSAVPGLGGSLGQAAQAWQAFTGDTLGAVSAVGIADAALLALAVGGVAKATQSFIGLSDSVRLLSQMTGLTEQTAQAMNYALESVGASGDTTRQALDFMARNSENLRVALENGTKPAGQFANALQELGINAKQFTTADADTQLKTLLNAFQNLSPSVNRTALEMDVFSRGGAQMAPLLAQGSGALDVYKAKMDAAGAGVSDTQARVLALHSATTDLDIAEQGISNTVGDLVVPVLASLAGRATEAATAIHEATVEVSDFEGELKKLPGNISLGNLAEVAISPIDALIDSTGVKLPAAVRVGIKAIEDQLDPISRAKDSWDLLGKGLDLVTGKHHDAAAAAQQHAAAEQEAAAAARAEADDQMRVSAAIQQSKYGIELVIAANRSNAEVWDTVEAAVKKSSATISGQEDFQTRLAKAIDESNKSIEQQRLDNIDLQGAADNSTGSVKAGYEQQLLLNDAVVRFGPAAVAAAEQLQVNADATKKLSDAFSQAASNDDFPTLLKLITDNLNSTGKAATEARKALDAALSKPSAAELGIEAQVKSNEAAIASLNKVIADSSPIDQRIAALTRQRDEEIRTGASTKTREGTEHDLAAQLAAVPAAEGAAIVARQQQIDKLGQVDTTLTANEQAMAANREAADAYAKANSGVGASAADEATAIRLAYGDVATSSGTLDSAITTTGGLFDRLKGSVLDAMGALDSYKTSAATGIPGLAGGAPLVNGAVVPPTASSGAAAAPTGGANRTQADIIAWANANAARLGIDPHTLAEMELGLNQYENPGGVSENSIGAAGPFQMYQGLRTAADALPGGVQSAGNDLTVLAAEGDRVRRAYAAYVAAGGGAAGLHAAENIQEIPGEDAIQARGGTAGFVPAYNAARVALGSAATGTQTPEQAAAAANAAVGSGGQNPVPTPDAGTADLTGNQVQRDQAGSIQAGTTARSTSEETQGHISELAGGALPGEAHAVTEALLAEDRQRADSARATALASAQATQDANAAVVADQAKLDAAMTKDEQAAATAQMAIDRATLADKKQQSDRDYQDWKTLEGQKSNDEKQFSRERQQNAQDESAARRAIVSDDAAFDQALGKTSVINAATVTQASIASAESAASAHRKIEMDAIAASRAADAQLLTDTQRGDQDAIASDKLVAADRHQTMQDAIADQNRLDAAASSSNVAMRSQAQGLAHFKTSTSADTLNQEIANLQGQLAATKDVNKQREISGRITALQLQESNTSADDAIGASFRARYQAELDSASSASSELIYLATLYQNATDDDTRSAILGWIAADRARVDSSADTLAQIIRDYDAQVAAANKAAQGEIAAAKTASTGIAAASAPPASSGGGGSGGGLFLARGWDEWAMNAAMARQQAAIQGSGLSNPYGPYSTGANLPPGYGGTGQPPGYGSTPPPATAPGGSSAPGGARSASASPVNLIFSMNGRAVGKAFVSDWKAVSDLNVRAG